jgi:DNA/RNA-binding domain of Phe-tRNA-synthetase-like protein
MLTVEPHPLLEVAAFTAAFPAPLGMIASSDTVRALLAAADAPAPMRADDAVRAAVRDLLRHGGYKPTGRGKPSSEYLLRAVSEGALASINAVVDACNAVSLHSGLPISVVDLDRARAPFRVALALTGTRYVFNASGQEIDLGGLVGLFDAEGPCANAVKDAQRTKTSAETRRVLVVVWGTHALPGRAQGAAAWYRGLLVEVGAMTEELRADADRRAET